MIRQIQKLFLEATVGDIWPLLALEVICLINKNILDTILS